MFCMKNTFHSPYTTFPFPYWLEIKGKDIQERLTAYRFPPLFYPSLVKH